MCVVFCLSTHQQISENHFSPEFLFPFKAGCIESWLHLKGIDLQPCDRRKTSTVGHGLVPVVTACLAQRSKTQRRRGGEQTNT